MLFTRITLIVMMPFLMTSCCDKSDISVPKNMYLEGIAPSERDVVEAEAETSIIDGTTLPYDHNFADQASFSFSDQWAWNKDLSNYYGTVFFSKIPDNQDIFLTFSLSLDESDFISHDINTQLSVCGAEPIQNALLYQNPNPPVEDNLLHKKASISIPVLIDLGVISDANTSKDLCFHTRAIKIEEYGVMCSRLNTFDFNEIRVSGEEIIQVIKDLESNGTTFDYNNL